MNVMGLSFMLPCLALLLPSCRGDDAQSPTSKDTCPPIDSRWGKPVLLPSACERLRRVVDRCGLDVDTSSCKLDEDCELRECYLRCLEPSCAALQDASGEEQPLDCFQRCSQGLFCGGGYVPPERLCDGQEDCPNGSDERMMTGPDDSAQCVASRSGSPHFCWGSSFGAVPIHAICDGEAYCANGKDELDASCPLGLLYHCDDSDLVVPQRGICDGVADCPKADDEPCSAPVARCPERAPIVDGYLARVNTHLRFNGSICMIRALGPRETPGMFNVPSSQGTCENGEPYIARQVCDGTLDCEDGADEAGCPIVCEDGECSFPCASGELVPLTAVCDGSEDCPGGDDEPCTDHFACGFGHDIPYEQVCDGIEQCEDGEDELSCPVRYFLCEDGSEILYPHVQYFAEGSCILPQCADGSDMGCLNDP